MKKVTEFLPKDHVSPRFSVKQYKKQVEGQISDPCQAQFWVKQQVSPPSEPDAEERESSVMGDWGGDELDGSFDLESEVVEPDLTTDGRNDQRTFRLGCLKHWKQ